MRKVLLALTVVVGLLSCEKEEDERSTNSSSSSSNNSSNCTCGIIANDGIDTATNCYWLEIRNECSGNKKKFCFDEDVWTNNFVGDRFCVYNVKPW